MTNERPRGLDGRRVRQLLAGGRKVHATASRVELFSRLLLGCPYEPGGLVGSAETPEVFTASLDAFDCVTYVETVLALARASGVSAFSAWLRRIRYEDGEVAWSRRNHYVTGWIRANARAGVIRRVPPGGREGARAGRSVAKERLLDAVPGLPPRRERFTCVPKREVRRLLARLEAGDLVFFASTRAHLDVFHGGILVRGEQGWRLRHASRSRKGVVEEELGEFLARNRMAGVIAVRPVEEPREEQERAEKKGAERP